MACARPNVKIRQIFKRPASHSPLPELEGTPTTRHEIEDLQSLVRQREKVRPTTQPRMIRREVAMSNPPDPIKESVASSLALLLDPEPGKMLPRGYVAKRRADGVNGPGTGRWELVIVPRCELTLSERAAHIRRLRKPRRPERPVALSKADSLEAETVDLISNGNLRLTADELVDHYARPRQKTPRSTNSWGWIDAPQVPWTKHR
jgi:hypothetical protein